MSEENVASPDETWKTAEGDAGCVSGLTVFVGEEVSSAWMMYVLCARCEVRPCCFRSMSGWKKE